MATRAILTALLLCFSACSVDKSAKRMGDGDEQNEEQAAPPDEGEDPPDAGG